MLDPLQKILLNMQQIFGIVLVIIHQVHINHQKIFGIKSMTIIKYIENK